MLNQWQHYKKLSLNFKFRLERFRRSLYSQKIEEIVSEQIKGSEKRFIQWFFVTFVTYVIVIVLSIVAAVYVPKIMQSSNTTPPTQSTPQNLPSVNPQSPTPPPSGP